MESGVDVICGKVYDLAARGFKAISYQLATQIVVSADNQSESHRVHLLALAAARLKAVVISLDSDVSDGGVAVDCRNLGLICGSFRRVSRTYVAKLAPL